ncbi:sce7726 family protein [Ancylobacter sp. A5.8]|uniref:sce7726 family protein n=1 Tax=Ancylobacter gelatini TaxID=2919920 RepID=UPI001F4E015D|nr:sce7726 family protein [Ancylobacter gelatini]MCJ8143839.1 sce7726 family protein [Ancylobacter gelatini]
MTMHDFCSSEHERELTRSSPEAIAKIAIIETLRSKWTALPNAIISEFCFNSSKSRADLVIIDKDITCFEIKTDSDNLSRLKSQIDNSYLYFDRVIVVAATKHLKRAGECIPAGVGLWELCDNGALKVRVRPKISRKQAETIAQLMTISDLRACLRGAGVQPKSSLREDLLAALEGLPPRLAREFAVSALTRRFRSSTVGFLSQVAGRQLEVVDIRALSRFNEVRASVNALKAQRAAAWRMWARHLNQNTDVA